MILKMVCYVWYSLTFVIFQALKDAEKLSSRLQLECDGTRWRTGEEVKGKLANGVRSQYTFTLPRNVLYPALLPLMRTPRLPVVDWTEAPADLNGLVRFAERWNLVSASVQSHFNWSLLNMELRYLNWTQLTYTAGIGEVLTVITGSFFLKIPN